MILAPGAGEDLASETWERVVRGWAASPATSGRSGPGCSRWPRTGPSTAGGAAGRERRAEVGDRPDTKGWAQPPDALVIGTRPDAGAWMRFRLDRRWAMLVVAVVLGAIGGSALGFVTAPGPSGDAAEQLVPSRGAAAPTSRRPRGRVAGTSSTRPRPRALPAPTAPTASTARPTTTTAPRPTSTTREPTTTSTTTTTTVGQDTTSTTTSSTLSSSTTSTT